MSKEFTYESVNANEGELFVDFKDRMIGRAYRLGWGIEHYQVDDKEIEADYNLTDDLREVSQKVGAICFYRVAKDQ